MQQHPLAVILNIKPEQKAQLKDILHTIQADINNNPYLRFPEITTTHFARFVLIGGGIKATRDLETRLYFSANHDGEWEEYIDLLLDKAGKALEAIFSACEGYPNVSLTDPAFKARFKDYLRANSCQVNTFYQGYPGKSVQEVQHSIERHAVLERLANQKGLDGIKAEFKPSSGPAFGNIISKIWDNTGGKLISIITAPLRDFLGNVLKKLLDFVLGKIVGIRLFPETLPPLQEPSPEVDTRIAQTDYLESVQNEMTTISAIDPKQLRALKIMLWIVNMAARYLFNKGELGGISTIHFARWIIIDNGKTLLFESNYDGNWEQYIGDFVDKAAFGMNSIWGNSDPSVNYPKYGAKDLQTFKKVIIDHQVPAAVFYTAYRNDSVRNILNDLAIDNLFGGAKSSDAFNELTSRL